SHGSPPATHGHSLALTGAEIPQRLLADAQPLALFPVGFCRFPGTHVAPPCCSLFAVIRHSRREWAGPSCPTIGLADPEPTALDLAEPDVSEGRERQVWSRREPSLRRVCRVASICRAKSAAGRSPWVAAPREHKSMIDHFRVIRVPAFSVVSSSNVTVHR